MPVKALVLFSGGLDSLLAAKVLLAQGIAVTPVCFCSNFFDCSRARQGAAELGLTLKVADISAAILDLVKNPPSGYGQNMNPCLDCHTLMIKAAGAIMEREGYDFIATGEVLGQRPFSQNRPALDRIRHLSGREILRPLSAQLLAETAMERRGLVARSRLYGWSGRQRTEQLRLAKQFGLKTIPSPAGGCLLTDPGFALRLSKLIDYWPDCSVADAELIKHGRMLWLDLTLNGCDYQTLLMVGRAQPENDKLRQLVQKGDILIELAELTGPLALWRHRLPLELERNDFTVTVPSKLSAIDLTSALPLAAACERVATLTAYFTPKARGKETELTLKIINH